MAKRQRRTFTPEFKEQMVKLYGSGKLKNDIIVDVHGVIPLLFH